MWEQGLTSFRNQIYTLFSASNIISFFTSTTLSSYFCVLNWMKRKKYACRWMNEEDCILGEGNVERRGIGGRSEAVQCYCYHFLRSGLHILRTRQEMGQNCLEIYFWTFFYFKRKLFLPTFQQCLQSRSSLFWAGAEGFGTEPPLQL